MEQFVTYTRVSTKRQGRSGLGLEAQQRDMDLYFTNYATEPYEIIGQYCDIESGMKSDNVQFNQAVELAKRTGATLLVAKLDRISRRVSVIAGLMEDKRLKLRVASMPNADNFQLHIFAALAEQERQFISLRTKGALQAARARGVKLGGARAEAEVRHIAVKAKADQFALRFADLIRSNREAGKTYAWIADHLNELGVTTVNGRKWFPITVQRYAVRLGRCDN